MREEWNGEKTTIIQSSQSQDVSLKDVEKAQLFGANFGSETDNEILKHLSSQYFML